MKKNYILLIILLLGILLSCSYKKDLSLGIWRATLKTESGAEIPFNFILADSAGKKQLTIINGDERFRVPDIVLKDDSVIINMPLFDSEIRAVTENGNLHGQWVKHLATRNTTMEFDAEPRAAWRFFKAEDKSDYNVTGSWSSVFVSQNGRDTTLAVGEFKQQGQKVTGTFLTTTGDYRFLEGTVSENKLFLSCFDGSHAFLFTGRLTDGNTIADGKFYSGYSSVDNWSAKKDNKAMLPDAYSLTALKPGAKKISFSFPDLDGRKISLTDAKFAGKVVIVQFMGSWCPNCMDETAYLAPFYEKYKNRGVEIVGLAYERSKDFERSKKSILKLKNRFNVQYNLLITGYTNDKAQVAESMPALDKFQAFPTTIIIDKKGNVRKIHTGFSGPGTGNHYTEFTAEFEKLINNLLTEK